MIRILTDTTSDLTLQEAKEKDIDLVSLKVIFGEETYDDQREISPIEFYEKMASSPVLPTTSQPSPNDFLAHFKKAKENDDEVVAILLSSEISGTYQSACIAKMMCEYEHIHIIDSRQAIGGLQALVRLAYVLKEEGKSAKEIVDIIEAKKEKVCLLAAVDTLENFIRGGRLSKTAGFAGTLLKLKPVVTLSDGKLEVLGKTRGMIKAINDILERMEETGVDTSLPVYFGYSGVENPLDTFKKKVYEKYSFKESYESVVGPVIGVHAGAGAQAIVYFKK